MPNSPSSVGFYSCCSQGKCVAVWAFILDPTHKIPDVDQRGRTSIYRAALVQVVWKIPYEPALLTPSIIPYGRGGTLASKANVGRGVGAREYGARRAGERSTRGGEGVLWKRDDSARVHTSSAYKFIPYN